ncbi:MAG: hypothetical protein ACRD0P_28190 [Stackebrandtia sp.]
MNTDQLPSSVPALAERYADRLDPVHARMVGELTAGGEWAEAVDVLVLALRTTHAQITPPERDELIAVMTTCELPIVLEGITITG